MPQPFHDVSLPDDFSRGASGGPGFHTTVLVLSSGFEKRNIDWADARASYTVGFGIRRIELIHELIEFFRARYGRAYGFRFRDWSDYTIPFPGGSAQTLGVGDGATTTFQLIKTYADGAGSYVRNITKPVDNGSIEIRVNGTLKTEGADYTVNYSTGVVTLAVAPTGSQTVTTTYCEFDVPVRFDTDQMDVAIEVISAGMWEGVKLVELRE